MRRFFVAAALVIPAAARADTQACVDAHVSVQEKRLAGDLRGAYAATETCAATPCPAALRAECERWRDDLVVELPTVEIAVVGIPENVARSLQIDGELHALAGPVALNPGHHSIELTVDGKPTRRSLHLVQGQRAKLLIDLRAEGPEPPPLRPPAENRAAPVGPIVLGAAGVAALGVFAVMGGLGVTEYSELESGCAPRCTTADTDIVDTEFLVADIALGIGSAALLSGAIWLIVDLTANRAPITPTARGLTIAF